MIKNYVKAESLEQAYVLNQQRFNCIIAGNLWVRMSKQNITTAIDLSDLGLDRIEETEEEFRIGCMTSLRQLEKHEGLQQYSNYAVREAVRNIVGVQFRNLATVGGSIFGRFGFSDVLTVFLVMDSYVELYHAGIVPLREFVDMPGDRDILVRLIVKKQPAQYLYQSVRGAKTDFPTLTCAAAKQDTGYTFAIGARPQRAVLITDEKKLLTEPLTKECVEAFANDVAESVEMRDNMRGSAAYRTHLAKVLVTRALTQLGGNNDAG